MLEHKEFCQEHPNFLTWISERAPWGIIDLGRGGCDCQIKCEKCHGVGVLHYADEEHTITCSECDGEGMVYIIT